MNATICSLFIVAANIDKQKDTRGVGQTHGFQDTATDSTTNAVEHCEAAAEFVKSVSSSESKEQSTMRATKDNHTGTICTFKQITLDIYICNMYSLQNILRVHESYDMLVVHCLYI